MRVELTPQPLQIDLAAQADRGDGESPARRIVGGLVVPYEKPARIMGREITFASGSVTPADHVPYILAHNLDRPIGVMLTGSDGEAGFAGVFKIDETPDGDTAIAQAKSGSRRGLSGGLDVIRAEEDEAGNLRVLEAQLSEVSQVTLAAFQDAAIETVAAHKSEGGTMSEPTPAPDPADETHPEAAADPPRPVIVTADREPPRMRLGSLVQTMIRAHKGDREAIARVEAQLNREELADSPGVVPIAYVTELIDSLGATRPLFDAFSKAPLPPAGMTIRRPVVTVRPAGGWLATDADPAPTGPISIGTQDDNIEQWAHAVAASVAMVERSDPGYVESAFTQILKAYMRAVEAKIGAALDAIAAPATTPPTTLGAAGALYTGAYGEWPTLIVAGPVAFGHIVDAMGPMRYSTGSADLTGTATIAGLPVVCAPAVTAADAWVTSRDLLESRESSPIRLSVSDVTSLSLEFGVTSFYSLSTTRQTLGGVEGAVRISAFVPQPAEAQTQSSGRSSKS